jgi:hypothetical protein
MSARAFVLCAAGAIVALATAGCSALRISTYQEPGADLARYQTYDWASHATFSTGDPRLDNNRFFIERVQRAVDRELASRGLERAASAPDVMLHIHARFDQQIRQADLEPASAPATQRGRTEVYDAGTVMLDIVDSRTQRLAWRGWAEGAFDGVVDDQDWLDATIDRTVAKILDRFPRRAATGARVAQPVREPS